MEYRETKLHEDRDRCLFCYVPSIWHMAQINV